MGFLLGRTLHADRGFMRMQNTMFQQGTFQCLYQRQWLHNACTHPFSQGGARELEAGTVEDAFLRVQREVVGGVFGYRHLSSGFLSITCAGTYAWVCVSQLSQAHLCRIYRSAVNSRGT